MTRTAEDNAVEFGVLSKQGKDLRLALLAACSVENDGAGGNQTIVRTHNGKLKAATFAKKAGTTHTRVLRHLTAWDAFAKKVKLPVAAKLTPDDATDLDITDKQAEVWETIVLSNNNRGTRVTPTSVGQAIKANPQVAAAAAQGLVDAGALDTLSKATAAAAKNRQVERNRKRATSGMAPQPQVQAGIPKQVQPQPGVAAFMSVKGLSDALRALVTTFPQEWTDLTDEARDDEDFIENCEEMCDKIEIALADVRAMISGGVTDEALERLLEEA